MRYIIVTAIESYLLVIENLPGVTTVAAWESALALLQSSLLFEYGVLFDPLMLRGGPASRRYYGSVVQDHGQKAFLQEPWVLTFSEAVVKTTYG